MASTETLVRIFRLLNASSLLAALACAANYYLEWGFFGNSAELVMMGSFLALGIIVFLTLGSRRFMKALYQESDESIAERVQPLSTAWPRSRRALVAFWILVLGVPILVWWLDPPRNWSTLIWLELLIILSAQIVLRRMRKAVSPGNS